ncbi:MAG: hypothetical protein HZB39_04825 [Planctomycetes bacterium]|nr:hypothetical protein [Planctomycetota bacterium]
MQPQLLPLIGAAAFAASLLAQAPIPALSDASFRALHAQVVPQACETWETIPWRVDLLAAVREAEATGRPLFLWTMNGHPLGCT